MAKGEACFKYKKECDFGSDQTCLHSRSVLRADVDENGGELGQPRVGQVAIRVSLSTDLGTAWVNLSASHQLEPTLDQLIRATGGFSKYNLIRCGFLMVRFSCLLVSM